MKIKQDDKVLIISGKNKGKTGNVMRVLKKIGKITVEKVNLRTRHIPARQAGQQGQKIQYEAPIDASNAKLICPNCDKAVRVGYSQTKDGKKYRVCKKCNESVEKATTKTSKKK